MWWAILLIWKQQSFQNKRHRGGWHGSFGFSWVGTDSTLWTEVALTPTDKYLLVNQWGRIQQTTQTTSIHRTLFNVCTNIDLYSDENKAKWRESMKKNVPFLWVQRDKKLAIRRVTAEESCWRVDGDGAEWGMISVGTVLKQRQLTLDLLPHK